MKRSDRPARSLRKAVEEPGVAVVLLAVRRELPAQIRFYEGVHREDEEAGIYPLEPGEAGEIVVDSRRHASFLCFQRRSSSLGTSPHPNRGTGPPAVPLIDFHPESCSRRGMEVQAMGSF